MKNLALLPLFAVVFQIQACSGKDIAKAVSNIAAEDQIEMGSQSTSDAISAASAAETESAAAAGLSLAGDGGPFKSKTRTCVEQSDGSALVTVSSDLDLQKSLSNGTISRTQTLTGASTETRLWKHPSGVKCVNQQHAQVDLESDPLNYSLSIKIDRSRQQTMTQTNSKKNTSLTSSRSFSMTGERSVSIISYKEGSAANHVVVEKKVAGSMSRSFSFVNKKGEAKSGSLTSASVGDPLLVKVTRSLSSKEVISREIVSGVRKNTLTDGSAVEVSFSQFLMKGSGEECEAQSGSLSIKFLDSAGALSKTLSCSAEAGVLSCTDEAGSAVELESPSCDPADEK